MNYFEEEKTIYFAKTNKDAIIPSKKDEDAGYDFYSCFEEDYMVVEKLQTRLIPTGIAWASSPKYYLQIEERSGTGSKGIKRSAGVIDSGYRGEIKIALFNATGKTLLISKLPKEELVEFFPNIDEYEVYPYTKAIAQGVVHKVKRMEIKEIDYEELMKISSERGDGAWGHSGK